MLGRTPYEAWSNYVTPLRDALRCVTPGRFVLRESGAGLRVNVDYSLSLNDMNSVPMKAPTPISLIAGQIVRIHDWSSGHTSERFRVSTENYAYGFTSGHDGEEQELLTFHWSQDQRMSSAIPRGHLHVGRGLLASPTVIRPGDFQNAHIPTAQVPFSAVVRFAITELGVRPRLADWESILARSEALSGLPTSTSEA